MEGKGSETLALLLLLTCPLASPSSFSSTTAQLEQVASRPSIQGQGQQQRLPRHPQSQRRCVQHSCGRFTTLNGFSLPILQFLQLSAERVVLYRDALVTPHCYMNCHGMVYCTRGNWRIQVVNEEGENVFNGGLQEGQLIVVPQAYAVMKKAGQKGFRVHIVQDERPGDDKRAGGEAVGSPGFTGRRGDERVRRVKGRGEGDQVQPGGAYRA